MSPDEINKYSERRVVDIIDGNHWEESFKILYYSKKGFNSILVHVVFIKKQNRNQVCNGTCIYMTHSNALAAPSAILMRVFHESFLLNSSSECKASCSVPLVQYS